MIFMKMKCFSITWTEFEFFIFSALSVRPRSRNRLSTLQEISDFQVLKEYGKMSVDANC